MANSDERRYRRTGDLHRDARERLTGFACGTVAAVTEPGSDGYAYATYTAGTGVGGFCVITARPLAVVVSGTTTVDQS